MSDPARWLDDTGLAEHEREALRALALAGPEREQSARMVERLTQLTSAPQVGGSLLRTSRWGWITGGLVVALLAVTFVQRSTPPVAVPAPPPQSHAPVSRAAALQAATPEPPPARAAPRPPSVRPPARAPARDPGAELALLTPARQLLAVDPARALALADEHAQRFPRGSFREERAFLRIEALLRLGQRVSAERDVRAFLRAHPGSTYQHRLQQLLLPAP